MQSAWHRVGPPQQQLLFLLWFHAANYMATLANLSNLVFLSARKQPCLEGLHYFQMRADENCLDTRSGLVPLVFLTSLSSTPNPEEHLCARGNFHKGWGCSFLACGPYARPRFLPLMNKNKSLKNPKSYPALMADLLSLPRNPQHSACSHYGPHKCCCVPRETAGFSPPKRPHCSQSLSITEWAHLVFSICKQRYKEKDLSEKVTGK